MNVRILLTGLLGILCLTVSSAQLPSPKAAENRGAGPKLEAVAETKLLMNGLIEPNFRGFNRTLKDKPAEAEAWQFARGQALLVAEAGNLLMMRGPRLGPKIDTWMAKATDLRTAAAKLGEQSGKQDYIAARAALVDVVNACNRCHEAFHVKKTLEPFGEK
jgi:hypothetical protein